MACSAMGLCRRPGKCGGWRRWGSGLSPFWWFARPSVLRSELIGVESAKAVAINYAGQIDKVHQCVDLIEPFALQYAADEGLARWPVARWVFAAGPVNAAGGGDGAKVFHRFGG